MGDLLDDLLNNRLKPVQMTGTVDGVMKYDDSDDEEDNSYSSQDETDGEQLEYVRKEMNSYFREKEETESTGGLTDIEDDNDESIADTDLMELVTVPRVFDMYKFDTYYKKELPIDSYKGKIMGLINIHSVVIIQGPTGCGKTTQVPQYIIDDCKENRIPCNIVVTQPRRIAAINIAQRVCEERGWAMGTVCGYQVGLDRKVGDDVILTYMTTEVLLQKLISEKNLNKYTHIIIDEVHERTKALDFLLLMVRKYLFTNSHRVKIVLMSATMESEDFAFYFRTIPRNNIDHYYPPPVLKITKQSQYRTAIYHNEQFTTSTLTYNIEEPSISSEQYQMCAKLIELFDGLDKREVSEGPAVIGSVLVFLPGLHEIEEMQKILMTEKKSASGLLKEIIPLHSSLSSEHMLKAFQKAKEGHRKIILSTNIAESSVTVPDVKYVVDFCLTKIMTTNDCTKFANLSLQWASHNNCTQRAGRVGRVANGRVYRLVPYEFYRSQMQSDIMPELQRAPLENIILYMKLLNLNDTPKNVLALAISPPNLKDVETCIWHLKEVGALLMTCRGRKTAQDGDLTFIGRVMGSLPIDIRLAKLVLLGHMFSCLDETVIMAAGCMTRNIFLLNLHDRFKTYRKKLVFADGSASDFLLLLNLYNVWNNKRRENAFRAHGDEISWCKTNFVSLKGLREWEILIKEIHSRLLRFGIQQLGGRHDIRLTSIEKPTILKVVICGAFYPNYFMRSEEYGQIDAREAVKLLNNRDPYNTVYFTNMSTNQPGHIYVRQIKKLLDCENNSNVHIGFDGQSSKVFVEFKNIRTPQQVNIDGRLYVATVSAKIAEDVYEAVRKRQLKVPFNLRVLPSHRAWHFAEKIEEKKTKPENDEHAEEFNCYSTTTYTPLPPLDIEYISVLITHVFDVGHFYCQNFNDETRLLLDTIFTCLNGPQMFLEPVKGKINAGKKLYAARFNDDSKFYRCKVLNVTPGTVDIVQVQFIDYGNPQRVPVTEIYKLPENCPECFVEPIAMCCVLSEVQPHLVTNPQGIWNDSINKNFKAKTSNVLLNARVYSVVDGVVHLELYQQGRGAGGVSFNAWLIKEGHGQKLEESHRSKVDHETRQKVLASDHPSFMSSTMNQTFTTTSSYTDFEAPSVEEATETIFLKGPYSPLEMKIHGVMKAGNGAMVKISGDSVNTVLLDISPEDPHSRMLVAAQVSSGADRANINLSQTTMMPGIPGLPMLMTLLFCPTMEPKLTPDGCKVASILCGMGQRDFSTKPNFGVHDIVLGLDTELNEDIVHQINNLRILMNQAIKYMSNISDGLAENDELCSVQHELKDNVLSLLQINLKKLPRTHVRHEEVWGKNIREDLEILRMDREEQIDDIWPMLWFVKLVDDKHYNINQNLEELSFIAKRLVPERELICELCKSQPLRSVSDVRIHLFRDQHTRRLAEHKSQNNIS